MRVEEGVLGIPQKYSRNSRREVKKTLKIYRDKTTNMGDPASQKKRRKNLKGR